MPTILDRPTTPSVPTEPVSTTFTVDAVEPCKEPEERASPRRLVHMALERLPLLGAAAPRLLPAVQGVLLVLALAVSGVSWAAHPAIGLRRFAMWMAIVVGGGVIGTFALCSPPRDPLPAPVPSDAQMIALGRVA